jgi:2,5-diketo-D-gluconate reductase A
MQVCTLNNGVAMPQLGLGVWQVSDAGAEAAVAHAVEIGYRSVDTATLYGNEAGVGRAVRSSGVPRDDLFVTTKLWNTDHGYDQALRAFDTSLERLGMDYVDLYLIHWPMPAVDRYVDTWKALEKIYADGRARAIGVSNFTVETLGRLLAEAEVVPAVNQVELHPYLQQAELRRAHAEHGIATEAWSPLGKGGDLLDDPVLGEIARQHGRSVAQVALRWNIQRGTVVIPKSVRPERMAENFDVFDFELSPQEMDRISGLDRRGRLGPDPATMSWMG